MHSYRDLLQQVKAEIDEVDAPRRSSASRRPAGARAHRRSRARRVGGRQDPGRRARPARLPRVADRAGRAGPRRADRRLLRRRQPLGIRCQDARRARLHERLLARGRLHRVEARRARLESPRSLGRRQRARYSRHLLIPEVGEEGQLKLLDSRVLLLGAGGLGSPAALYLAAAGVGTIGIVDPDVVDDSNLQRQVIHSTERIGEPKVLSAKKTLEALNPDVTVVPYEERLDSDSIERILGRPLGPDRRRRRQLPHALSRQRCLRLARDPGRAWLDLPLPRPGDRVQAWRWPVLPLPLPAAPAARARAELRGGRRARRPARASSARCRRTRRSSSCSGSATRSSAARSSSRRSRARSPRSSSARIPACPVCGEAADDHRLHRLRRVLPGRRRPPERRPRRARRRRGRVVTKIRIPPTLRAEVGGAREVEAAGGTMRDVLGDLADALPRPRRSDPERRRHRAVRERLPRQRGRAHAAGARHTGRRRARRSSCCPPWRAARSPLVQRPPLVASSVLDLIGSTPLVELRSLTPNPAVKIYAKLEGQNPTGSIKDRVAKAMIETAEARGELVARSRAARADERQHGHLARDGREAQGLPADLRDARERDARAHPPARALRREGRLLAGRGGLERRRAPSRSSSPSASPRYFMPFQYANEANPRAHYEGTGAEIAEALPRVDAFVAGLGTGGTLMGCAERLRESFPEVQVVAAEPLQGDLIYGLRSLDDGYTPPILDVSRLDRKILVSNQESVVGLQLLLEREGIFAGVSCGAVIHVARQDRARAGRGRRRHGARRRRLEVPLGRRSGRSLSTRSSGRWTTASGGNRRPAVGATLLIPPEVRAALVEHAQAESPNECCGLIALRDGVAERYIPPGTPPRARTASSSTPIPRRGFSRTRATSSRSSTPISRAPRGPRAPTSRTSASGKAGRTSS